jgi:hypothetical protein
MGNVIAVALLLGATALLSLPWRRRDPDDFSMVELGYAQRGRRGAVLGALQTLIDVDAVRRSQVRGISRTEKRLPEGIDPFARVVYGGIGVRHEVRAFLTMKDVAKRMPALAKRVVGAGLRVGPMRRVAGTLAALAAPVVAIVELANAGGTAANIVVTVGTVAGAGVLLLLRGSTIGCVRTLAGLPPLEKVRLNRGRGLSASRDGTLGSSWVSGAGSDGTP